MTNQTTSDIRSLSLTMNKPSAENSTNKAAVPQQVVNMFQPTKTNIAQHVNDRGERMILRLPQARVIARNATAKNFWLAFMLRQCRNRRGEL